MFAIVSPDPEVWWARSEEGHVLLPKERTSDPHLKALRYRGPVLEVRDDNGFELWQPMLNEAEIARALNPHFEAIELAAKRYGVWLPHALATVFCESRGDARAMAPDGGMGLMQITHPSLKQGHTEAELLDPVVNLDIGCGLLSRLGKWSVEIPVLASYYNGGGQPSEQRDENGHTVKIIRPWKSAVSYWGMRETVKPAPSGGGFIIGYIDGVCAAANACIEWIKKGTC